VLGAVAIASAVLIGCTATGPGVRACTELGSPAGLTVTVTRDVAVSAPQVTLRVCQDACVEHRVDLHPGSVTGEATCTSDDPDGSCSASSSPDGTVVGFVDVPWLAAGAVRVSGVRVGSGGRSQLSEISVTAAATYPNGAGCPAGGPQAAVRVTADGLR
jgi:hypothetical protein